MQKDWGNRFMNNDAMKVSIFTSGIKLQILDVLRMYPDGSRKNLWGTSEKPCKNLIDKVANL